MEQQIMEILKSQIFIIFSWGADNFKSVKKQGYSMNGLQFNVNGFKFKGKVTVMYDGGADLFDVFYNNKDTNETKKGIYFDELVETIDNYVEKTDNYEETLKEYMKAEGINYVEI